MEIFRQSFRSREGCSGSLAGNVWQQNVNSSDPPCKISPSVRSLPPLVWCGIRSASDNDPGRVIDPQLDFSASQCSSSAAIISPIRLIKYMMGRPDFKIMGLQEGGGGGVWHKSRFFYRSSSYLLYLKCLLLLVKFSSFLRTINLFSPLGICEIWGQRQQ